MKQYIMGTIATSSKSHALSEAVETFNNSLCMFHKFLVNTQSYLENRFIVRESIIQTDFTCVLATLIVSLIMLLTTNQSNNDQVRYTLPSPAYHYVLLTPS